VTVVTPSRLMGAGAADMAGFWRPAAGRGLRQIKGG
jgi:hypothetical protein